MSFSSEYILTICYVYNWEKFHFVCIDNHYGTPKPPKQPVLSSATVAGAESTFHRSGSVGNIMASAQHPSSDGKRQRNRSNVETSSAKVDSKVMVPDY